MDLLRFRRKFSGKNPVWLTREAMTIDFKSLTRRDLDDEIVSVASSIPGALKIQSARARGNFNDSIGLLFPNELCGLFQISHCDLDAVTDELAFCHHGLFHDY